MTQNEKSHQPKPEVCLKCNGNGFYQYTTTGTPHSKPCEVCCKHTGEPWKHEDGKYYCKAGCGAEMPSPASTDEWEKEFDKEFRFNSTELNGDVNYEGTELRNNLKSFIRSHDQQLRQRIVEKLDKMKKTGKEKKMTAEERLLRAIYGKKRLMTGEEKSAYNLAVDDLLTFIKNLT